MTLSGFHAMPRDSHTSRLTDFGRVSAETQYASAAAFSAAVGARVTENVRLALEVGYAPVDIEAITNLRVEGHPVSIPYGLTGDSDVWTVTLAASYDFPTRGPTRPYVGAGAGIARHETRTTFTIAGFDPTTESGDDTVLGAEGRKPATPRAKSDSSRGPDVHAKDTTFIAAVPFRTPETPAMSCTRPSPPSTPTGIR